jgi:hypothetical protein
MSNNNVLSDERSQEGQLGEKTSVPVHNETGSNDSHDAGAPEWHLDFKIVMAFIVRFPLSTERGISLY